MIYEYYLSINPNIIYDHTNNKFALDDQNIVSNEKHNDIFKQMEHIRPNIYFDNIYIINLDKDIHKKKRLEKIFNDIGVKVQFFKGIMGNDPKYLLEYNGKNLSKKIKSIGAYGYIMSMIEVLNDAKKNKYNKFLVCDDDIILSNDFLKKFDEY